MLLWKIFVLFSRVALFSWGGGPASLALMQREVETAGWLTATEFADAVAIGNALPGPIAPQVSAYVGYKLAGTPGAIAAATGTVLPTTALMLLMVVGFFRIRENRQVAAMLRGVRPVVVGLLLWTAYDMGRSVMGAQKIGWAAAFAARWDAVALALVSFAVLTFTAVNPIWVILSAAAVGLACYR